VLQGSALRLCRRRGVSERKNQNHSLVQNSLKVIVFGNLQGVNEPLISKHFSLSEAGNEGTRFSRALRCR